jgi:23S rRNA (adenine2503-C2)-methyltransferase
MASLKDLFSPVIFNFTFSVICSADENLKSAGYRDLDKITELTTSFVEDGYNVRVFNPAGQDDIGGGCGQLWYVQDWMKINLNK